MKFSKNQRLVSKEDFHRVFETSHQKSKRNLCISHLGLYVVYTDKGSKDARLGISVSKKLLKHANKRNRVKRCVREFFRLHQGQLQGDFVIRLSQTPKCFDFVALTDPLKMLVQGGRA